MVRIPSPQELAKAHDEMTQGVIDVHVPKIIEQLTSEYIGEGKVNYHLPRAGIPKKALEGIIAELNAAGWVARVQSDQREGDWIEISAP